MKEWTLRSYKTLEEATASWNAYHETLYSKTPPFFNQRTQLYEFAIKYWGCE